MMHRRLTSFLVAAIIMLPLSARTASDFFINAPSNVIPLLDKNTRLDMIDYFTGGLSTASRNILNGNSRILINENNKIEIALSRESTLQIAVVELKKDTILAVIETVNIPVADSSLRFYNSDWVPLPQQAPQLTVVDFVASDKKAQANALLMPRMAFVKIDYNPNSGVFSFINTTADYYTDKDRPEGLELMRPHIDMIFDGKKLLETKPTKGK